MKKTIENTPDGNGKSWPNKADRRKTSGHSQEAAKMEAIGRLAGGVVHDFSNLLTGIQGIAQDLQERLSSYPDVCADLNEIQEAARRAFTVTRQLLAFSRRNSPEPAALDVNHTIEHFVQLLNRFVGEDIQIV